MNCSLNFGLITYRHSLLAIFICHKEVSPGVLYIHTHLILQIKLNFLQKFAYYKFNL